MFKKMALGVSMSIIFAILTIGLMIVAFIIMARSFDGHYEAVITDYTLEWLDYDKVVDEETIHWYESVKEKDDGVYQYIFQTQNLWSSIISINNGKTVNQSDYEMRLSEVEGKKTVNVYLKSIENEDDIKPLFFAVTAPTGDSWPENAKIYIDNDEVKNIDIKTNKE